MSKLRKLSKSSNFKSFAKPAKFLFGTYLGFHIVGDVASLLSVAGVPEVVPNLINNAFDVPLAVMVGIFAMNRNLVPAALISEQSAEMRTEKSSQSPHISELEAAIDVPKL